MIEVKPMTQKQSLATLKQYAADLGAVATIRKNLYGEYEVRVRMNGDRKAYAMEYFTNNWDDAVATAQVELGKIEDRQRDKGKLRMKAHADELAFMITHAQAVLNLAGCRLEVSPQDVVTFYSPKTGQHSLNMAFGVREPKDVLIHAVGFAEQQNVRS